MILHGADEGEVAGLASDALAFLARAFGDDPTDPVAQRLGLGDGARRRVGGSVAAALLVERFLVGRSPVGEKVAEA